MPRILIYGDDLEQLGTLQNKTKFNEQAIF